MSNSLDYSILRYRIVGMWRVQKQAILRDLNKKMVFIVGPRQAGKTWLAKQIVDEINYSVYLNYDSASDNRLQTRCALHFLSRICHASL